MVFQKSNPFPMSIFENVVYPLRIDGENVARSGLTLEACEKSPRRPAALWDEVKDRLSARLGAGAVGRAAAASVHRPRRRRGTGGAPARRALLRARPDRDAPKIEELIHEISERYTVLIVTHNMQQAARVSDYTAFMYLGRLVELGPTDQLFQNPTLPETEQYITGRFG